MKSTCGHYISKNIQNYSNESRLSTNAIYFYTITIFFFEAGYIVVAEKRIKRKKRKMKVESYYFDGPSKDLPNRSYYFKFVCYRPIKIIKSLLLKNQIIQNQTPMSFPIAEHAMFFFSL